MNHRQTSLMSEEQLKAFLEKVKDDTSLQEKLVAAADAGAVAAIAKEAGFSISADDLNNTQVKIEDADLEGAAGGGGGTTNQWQRREWGCCNTHSTNGPEWECQP